MWIELLSHAAQPPVLNGRKHGVNAAQHLMNQAPFRSTFQHFILVITKIFDSI